MSEAVLNDAPEGGERERLASSTAIAVKARMDGEGLTLSQVATLSGVPKGTLSPWLAGNYAGRVDRIDAQMGKWLESVKMADRVQRRMPVAPEFIETPSAQTFLTVFEYAQMSPDVGMIAGGSGVGKTSAAEHYCRTTPNAWLMTANSSMRSPTAILKKLTKLLECDEQRGPGMMDSVISRVEGTRGLLIVDEADHLQTESLDLLRTIYDCGRIGIVFVGNEPLRGRIEGMGRQASHARIFSRIGMRKSRSKPQYQDVMQVLDGWGIDGADLRKQARWIAMQPGGLRSMNKTLRYAGMLAAGDALTSTHLDEAWRELTGAALPRMSGGE